jgi:hypothetical protein
MKWDQADGPPHMVGSGEPEIMKCITSDKIADTNQNPQIEIMNPKSP